MLPGDSTVLGTAGFGGDVFEAGLRGFFAAFPLLRLALAVLVTFFRATFFVTLPFVLFLAINASSSLVWSSRCFRARSFRRRGRCPATRAAAQSGSRGWDAS